MPPRSLAVFLLVSSLAPPAFAADAPAPSLRVFGTAMAGDGLRFNNPYRLRHQLGKTGESLSLTAPYFDLAAAIAYGPEGGLQHGFHFAWSEALTGVRQTVLTPSYIALYRYSDSFTVWGRAGVPILLSPDANVGGEIAASAGYFFVRGVGIAASLVGSGFYGAGTREVKAAFYPVLSAQAGIILDDEAFR